MAGRVIASLAGTGLTPGVSKKLHHYPADLIGKAVQRAQARLADSAGRPITMRVAHPDPDTQQYAPVTGIVGAVREMSQADDGSMRFVADLYDTQAGRDVLALTDTRGGARRALRNVSIRGRFLGDTHRELVDGQLAETADDLELDGIDFTHIPGVDGARIDRVFGPGEPAEALALGGGYVCESYAARWTVLEVADQPAPIDPVLASAIAKLKAGHDLASLPRGEWQAASNTYLRDVFAPRAWPGRA